MRECTNLLGDFYASKQNFFVNLTLLHQDRYNLQVLAYCYLFPVPNNIFFQALILVLDISVNINHRVPNACSDTDKRSFPDWKNLKLLPPHSQNNLEQLVHFEPLTRGSKSHPKVILHMLTVSSNKSFDERNTSFLPSQHIDIITQLSCCAFYNLRLTVSSNIAF